jgi:ABC-type transporter Mla maintaining outer membrane lipid asymmetry ATPase subunit MlaF
MSLAGFLCELIFKLTDSLGKGTLVGVVGGSYLGKSLLLASEAVLLVGDGGLPGLKLSCKDHLVR